MKIIAAWLGGIIVAYFILLHFPILFMSNSANGSAETFFDINVWKVLTIIYCGGLSVLFLYVKSNVPYEAGRLLNFATGGYGAITGVWLLWLFAGWFLPPAVQALSQFLTENIGVVIVLALVISALYKE